MRKGGIPVKNEAEITIQNIVASANLGGKIHLEEAARQLPKSMYEPEQFPGLIHRMPDPKTVILLFASGKLVCTGAKKEAEVYRAVNNLHVMLEEKKLMMYWTPSIITPSRDTLPESTRPFYRLGSRP